MTEHYVGWIPKHRHVAIDGPEETSAAEMHQRIIAMATEQSPRNPSQIRQRARPGFRTSSRSYGNRSRTDANGAVGRQLVDENR